jgi:TolB protein
MTNTMKNYLITGFLLFSILVPLAPRDRACAERVYLDISTQETRKIKMAVPWFQNKDLGQQKQLLGRELSSDLGKALYFHGVITIIPQEQYGGNQAADWKKIGADFTVLGQYSITAENLELEIWLEDVAGGEKILGKTYSGTVDQREKMLFKFTDDVLESLTGKPGIADTRILFVNQLKNAKEVYLTDILAKNVRQVTRHKHLTVSPRFVPGGTYMSYTSYHSGNQNLYITDLRQSMTTRVLSRRKGLNLAPALFADGRRMILSQRAAPPTSTYSTAAVK